MILPSFLHTLLVLGIAGSPITEDFQKVIPSLQSNDPSNLVGDIGIPKSFVDGESMAYNTCASYRGKNGLTWKDVEICKKKFEIQAIEEGVYIPTYYDFIASDENEDGLVTYEEWMNWVMSTKVILEGSEPVITTASTAPTDYPLTTYNTYYTTISPLPEDWTMYHEIKLSLALSPAERFHKCESYRGQAGLTWNDVQACDEKFAEQVDEVDEEGMLYVPTYEDFMDADQNYDGIITFEEWKQWVTVERQVQVEF